MVKLILLFFMALNCSNAFAMESPFERPQQSLIKSVEVIGTLKGPNLTCEEAYFYKNRVAAHHSKCQVIGMGGAKTYNIMILSPTETIEVDMIRKTATKNGNVQTYMTDEFQKLSQAEQQIVAKNYKFIRFQRNASLTCLPYVEETEFMGKKVEIVTADEMTVWGWIDGGASLKWVKGNYISEATSAFANIDIPDEKLTIPEDIEVVFDEKADAHQRKAAKEIVKILNNPELQNLPVCAHKTLSP